MSDSDQSISAASLGRGTDPARHREDGVGFQNPGWCGRISVTVQGDDPLAAGAR
jgi:hypothetical protein